MLHCRSGSIRRHPPLHCCIQLQLQVQRPDIRPWTGIFKSLSPPKGETQQKPTQQGPPPPAPSTLGWGGWMGTSTLGAVPTPQAVIAGPTPLDPLCYFGWLTPLPPVPLWMWAIGPYQVNRLSPMNEISFHNKTQIISPRIWSSSQLDHPTQTTESPPSFLYWLLPEWNDSLSKP